MVVKVGDVAQHGQTKGREAGPAAGAEGGDADVMPAQLSTFLRDLQMAAVTPGAPTADGHMEPVPFHLELLCAGKASPGVKQILAGDTSHTTYKEIVERLETQAVRL